MNYHSGPQDENAMRIAYLIAGFVQQTLTPAEHEELDRWVEKSDENMRLFEELTDEENIAAGLQKLQERDSEEAYQKLRETMPFAPERKRRKAWPYMVAAACFILLAVGLYLFTPFTKEENGVAVVEKLQASDIQPGGNKALLTLADGKTIVLENQVAGDLMQTGGITISRPDSATITYHGAETKDTPLQFNTLATPAGGQYSLTLADGTRVWLNAASSLRYPVAFTGTERRVELTGEAYFEVVHNPSKPFFVVAKGQEVAVLGTKFNLEAYTEEETITTTLVQGSIQLLANGAKKVLSPGQQAVVKGGGPIKVQPADMESALAWKEGWFRFREATISDVMREIARWYDAQVVFEGKIDRHFNAEVERNLPVSKVLQLFEKTGSVHFQVSGKKIYVKP